MSNVTTSARKPSLVCTECPYVFTDAEVAAEDKSVWGHPCHGVKDEPGTVCESFRKPLEEAMTTSEPGEDLTVLPCTRDIIEQKLLTALSDDGGQVAILAAEKDLELLIEALHVFGTKPALEWARDLRRLRNESFRGFP